MAARALLAGLDWDAACSPPFIAAVIAGGVAPGQFNTWLAQDYLFVRGFAGFAGAVLASAPDGHMETYLGGVAALVDELAWFKAKAAERGLDLAATGMQAACAEYRALLAELHAAPYAVKAAAFWAAELCYNSAWRQVLHTGTDERYREFGARWGSAEFDAYVKQLEAHADEALAQSPDQTEAARAAVKRVAELEVGFWNMAYAQA